MTKTYLLIAGNDYIQALCDRNYVKVITYCLYIGSVCSHSDLEPYRLDNFILK